MSTGRARGRGRGGGHAAPTTTTNEVSTGPARDRAGRTHSGARPGSNATRGGFGQNGQATPFAVGKFARGNASKQASRTTPSAGGASTTSGNVEERYQALRLARERERKDAIRQGLMSDPNKPMKLSEAITPVGTCQTMCAEFERVQRVVQRDIWDEEKDPNRSPNTPAEEAMDESRMVKKFKRSAAGEDAQLPSDLRPPSVLKKTCDYLFHTILGEAKLAKVHHFVWDRTRAIRNDFSIQQLTKADDVAIAIECFERIARFHILSLHQLALEEKPYGAYDPKQEREQLDKTLLSLMQYYEDCRGRIPLPNEAEFRAYCVLFQLQDATPDLEDRVQSWPRAIATDQRVQQALKVYAAACNTWDAQGPFTGADRTTHVVARHDWESFWQLVKSRKVSYLMACVAEIYFNLVRKMVLSSIIRTTRVKTAGNTEWSLSAMARLFYFDDDQQLEDFCGRFGLEFRDLENGEDRYLDISRVTNRTLPQEEGRGPTQLKSYLVESKREHRALSAVIDGLSVRQARDKGMMVTDEEEDEGYEEEMDDVHAVSRDNGAVDNEEDEEDTLFVPEAKPENDTNMAAASTAAPKLSFGQPPNTGFFGKASSATTSAFGQPSSTASTFGQSSSTASSHSKPSSGFGRPSQTANSFAISGSRPLDAPRSSLFKAATSTSPFSQAPASATSTTLGINSLTSSAGENNQPKLSCSQAPVSSAPSLFAPKAVATPIEIAAPSLFSQKLIPAVGSGDAGGSTTPSVPAPSLSNPFASDATTFSFPSAVSTDQKSSSPSLEQKTPSSLLGQPFGAATAAPSQIVQSDTKLSSLSQPQPHSPTSNTASQQSTAAPQTGSSSPPRRLSALDTKPKRPSPLSNSFTASDATAAGRTTTQTANLGLKPPQRELFPQQPQQLPSAAPSRSVSTVSDFDAIITRLAKELVEDPTTGYLKQYIEFCVRGLVTEVQEKVYIERINREADDFRQFCLEDKYGKRWREIIRTRRVRKQIVERRKRQQRRLAASQDQDMGSSGSVLDSSSQRSSPRGSIITRDKPSKQVAVDALFQSTNGGRRFGGNRQARAGSKRMADSVDGGSVASVRQTGHKRAKSTSHSDGIAKAHESPDSGTSDPDVLKRSSFLGFSLAGDATHRAGTSTSTTRSTYFRMKAMGLKPVPPPYTGSERGTKRCRSESLDAATEKLNASSLARLDSKGQDRALMPPPSVRSVRSRPDDDDEALFARLRAAREALKENESFMKAEVAKTGDLRRSRSASQSDGESPSLGRARSEARLRLSGNSDLCASTNSRDVPAYRLRESRFVPREHYTKAIERANEIRASRSVQDSRPVSRTEQYEVVAPSPTKTGSGAINKEVASASWKSPLLFGWDNSESGDASGSPQFAQARVEPVPSSTSVASPGFGFTSRASATHAQAFPPAKPPNPFSHTTSVASGVRNGSNPFLQSDASAQSNPLNQAPVSVRATANAVQHTSQPITSSNISRQSWEEESFGQSSTSFTKEQIWRFSAAPDDTEQYLDHTIQPNHIPDALSASFGHQDSVHQSPFAPTTKQSPTPSMNSYMPSQAAPAAISLLSDDENDVLASNGQGGQNEAHGQADFFNQVNAAAVEDDSLFVEQDDEEDSHGFVGGVTPQGGYTGKFAALADDSNEDDEEDVLVQNATEVFDDSDLEEEDGEEHEPGSYLHGPPLAEEDLLDDEHGDIDEDADADEGGSETPNGQHRRDFSEDEQGYTDGDVEDEGDYDEDSEGYDEDEETDEDTGIYANAYQNPYGRQVYAAPPKRQVNEALQQVGNDQNEPIELSD